MPDYNTVTHSMSNTRTFTNEIGSLIADYSRNDRELFITNWVDMLIDMGEAHSITQASKIIAEKVGGVTHQAITRYYKGDK